MSEDTMDVLVAAYQALDSAEADFDALVRRVQDKQIRTEGVILVKRDTDGQVTVSQTGDHLGRKGLGWGGGVGLVVGLLSPPLLASVVVGGAVGGAMGRRFARHRADAGIEEHLGENLRPGTVRNVVFDLQPATEEEEKALHLQGAHETVAAGAAG